MSLRCLFGVHAFTIRHHILPSGDVILIFDQCQRCALIDSWGVAEYEPGAMVVMHEVCPN